MAEIDGIDMAYVLETVYMIVYDEAIFGLCTSMRGCVRAMHFYGMDKEDSATEL